MKKKILIVFPIPKQGLKQLRDKYDIIYPEHKAFTKEEQIKLIADCNAIISIFNIELDKDIIKAGKKLEVISNYGVGYNNIDINEAQKNNIIVSNTPNSVCEPTAELCIGLILSLVRNISKCNAKIRTTEGAKWGVMENLGNTLHGKTLGIIGMGKIGKSIALKAIAFGMKIIYYNRQEINAEQNNIIQAKYCSLNTLMTEADIISINCPLNPDTKNLIGKKELNLMKTTAYIINTARGGIINEEDLIDILKKENIAGAALDVFENEPYINKDFLSLNNTILVPHIGTSGIETRIEMAQEASENIISFWEGGFLKNKIC